MRDTLLWMVVGPHWQIYHCFRNNLICHVSQWSSLIWHGFLDVCFLGEHNNKHNGQANGNALSQAWVKNMTWFSAAHEQVWTMIGTKKKDPRKEQSDEKDGSGIFMYLVAGNGQLIVLLNRYWLFVCQSFRNHFHRTSTLLLSAPLQMRGNSSKVEIESHIESLGARNQLLISVHHPLSTVLCCVVQWACWSSRVEL